MSDNDELDTLINKLVHATDPEEVKALYRQWAESYDDDLDTFGYVAPQIGTALFSQLVDKNANIHDAGCGTGQVGKLLAAHGYTKMDGSDCSEDMLKQAQTIDCYQHLVQLDYAGPIDLPDNAYDAVISIGVYTKRFKQFFLNEMLRIIKPGGHLLFSCRPVYFEEVADLVKQLHLDGNIHQSSVVDDDYMIGQKAKAFYVTLTKTA